MDILFTILSVAAALGLCAVLIAWVCYRMAFYSHRTPKVPRPEFPLPEGAVYEPYHAIMLRWMKEVRKLPHEVFSIRSFDGLTLRGKYYEYAPGAPIELMFHGYRGDSERDLCGGVQRCFALGHSALIVDQRGCGSSEGNKITFGILERKDCLRWVDFMLAHFGPDVKIILTGISMGASTVLMAAGESLPPNVVGVLADCGFTSAGEIIQKVVKTDMKLPPKLSYPFVRLGAKLFAGFDPDETSALEAMGRCSLPVIFFHGEADDFVPHEMSVRNFEACTGRKELCLIPGAGHGLCYPAAPEEYLRVLGDFFDPILNKQ